jgi:hypothetical protein
MKRTDGEAWQIFCIMRLFYALPALVHADNLFECSSEM